MPSAPSSPSAAALRAESDARGPSARRSARAFLRERAHRVADQRLLFGKPHDGCMALGIVRRSAALIHARAVPRARRRRRRAAARPRAPTRAVHRTSGHAGGREDEQTSRRDDDHELRRAEQPGSATSTLPCAGSTNCGNSASWNIATFGLRIAGHERRRGTDARRRAAAAAHCAGDGVGRAPRRPREPREVASRRPCGRVVGDRHRGEQRRQAERRGQHVEQEAGRSCRRPRRNPPRGPAQACATRGRAGSAPASPPARCTRRTNRSQVSSGITELL